MKVKISCFFYLFFMFLLQLSLYAQSQFKIKQNTDLTIFLTDIRLEYTELGWHLFIKKKLGINSVLLTETTRDPNGKEDNYSFRAEAWNAYNGDEKRLLDGKELASKYSLFSIVDSTPEYDTELGSVFHLFIPKTLVYGFPWSRNGVVNIQRGTFINIRSFEKPYADYSGRYADNPFMFDFESPPLEPTPPNLLPTTEKKRTDFSDQSQSTNVPQPIIKNLSQGNPKPILTDLYSPHAVKDFQELSNGLIVYSKGPRELVPDVLASMKTLSDYDIIDVVFAIDATGSMWDDIEVLKKGLVDELTKRITKKQDIQYGLLFYRDFTDNFRFNHLPVKLYPFTKNLILFQTNLNTMSIPQKSPIGGDTPEAVYEALYASLRYFNWRREATKKIILIGDAEGHPRPRGVYGISKQKVISIAKKMNVTISAIIIPEK